MTQQEQLSRWRLILGAETEDAFASMGAGGLSQEELLMDSALGAIYGGPATSPNGWGTCGPFLTRRRWRWSRTTPLSARA